MSDKSSFVRTSAAAASVGIVLLLAACGGGGDAGTADASAAGAEPKAAPTSGAVQTARDDAHRHDSAPDLAQIGSPTLTTPRLPDAAPLGFSGNRTTSPVIGPAQPPSLVGTGGVRGVTCEVDFNDSGAKLMTSFSAWFDQIYVPWFQTCSTGRIDIRPTLVSHVHLGFKDFDISDCVTESPDGKPMKRVDGVCQLVDIEFEPRTYVSTHFGTELLKVRAYTPDATQYQRTTFALQRIRIPGNEAVRLCYRGYTLDDVASGGNGPADPWNCFDSLAPGYYDLSHWISNAYEVSITGKTNNSFSIDDLRVVFHPPPQ